MCDGGGVREAGVGGGCEMPLWEKICAKYISDKEKISKLNNMKTNIFLKMSKGFEQTFYQRRHLFSKLVHNKCLSSMSLGIRKFELKAQ